MNVFNLNVYVFVKLFCFNLYLLSKSATSKKTKSTTTMDFKPGCHLHNFLRNLLRELDLIFLFFQLVMLVRNYTENRADIYVNGNPPLTHACSRAKRGNYWAQV